jgi:tetratricopeptide (TPR) repeat protein
MKDSWKHSTPTAANPTTGSRLQYTNATSRISPSWSLKLITRASLLAVLTVSFLAPCWAVPDANGALAVPPPDLSADATMQSRLNYNLGLEQFEKAQAVEKQSTTLSDAKAKSAQKAVMAGYREARTRLEVAVTADPSLKEAWNLVGYTSRRLGEYNRSLEAYEKALTLNPAYPEAIEYRAEAYLALNRLEDAKTAYMALFALSPPHAKLLMDAMRGWVMEHAKKKGPVAAGDYDAFAKWVAERAALAQQTASLRSGSKLSARMHPWN